MRLLMRLASGLLGLSMVLSVPALAADISNSFWSEVDSSNNAASPNGWTSGVMLPSQVEPTARSMMGATKRFYNHINGTATSGGTANAQTLTYSVAPTAYVAGDVYTFKVGTSLTNTGATTLNVNSLGAIAVQNGGAALTGTELTAGKYVSVVYDGANFQLLNIFGTVSDTATGAITADRYAFGILSQSGLSANTVLTDGGFGTPNWDGIRAVMKFTANSTTLVGSPIAGYYENFIASHADVASAIGGYGVCKVNGSACWGFNIALSDGGNSSVQLFNEIDMNVTNTGTTVEGLQITGASTAQWSSGAGVFINVPGSGIKWPSGAFVSADSAASIALQAGGVPGTPGSSGNSQSIQFVSWTAPNTAAFAQIVLDSGKDLIFNAPPAGTHLFQLNGTSVLEVLTATPGSLGTGIGVLYNNGVTTAVQQVLVGASNSCGSARCLTVPN